MSLLSFFNRKTTAPVARERLQILLAHERALTGGNSDLAAVLQEEILAVIARHFAIDRDKVQVKMDRGKAVSTLEIDVELPTANTTKPPPPAEAAAAQAASAKQ